MPSPKYYQFQFNDGTSYEHGVLVSKRPDIPTAFENVEFVTVAGRDAPVTVKQGTYDNIKISIECGFLVKDPDEWMWRARDIRSWLSGSGKLTFTDSSDIFYKVKNVGISEFKRTAKRYGEFKVEFTCETFGYLHSGIKEYQISEVLYNPYSTCKPIYKIVGSGSCTLTVNGNKMTASVTDNITIDTDKMMAYREDEESVKELINTSVTGEYEDLYLKTGKNTITRTSGFTITIIPNWRYI